MPNRRRFAAIVFAFAALVLLPASASALKMVPGAGGTSAQVGTVSDVATADFNGDGESDAAVSTGANTALDGIHALISNGDGSFDETQIASGNPGYYSVYTGDFNGDGDQDILGNPYAAAGMNMFLGQGDGTFDPGFNINPPFTPYRFNSMAVGDLNGAGGDDIVIGGGFGQYAIGLASGGGNFSFTTGSVASGNISSVAIGRFTPTAFRDFALGDDTGEITVLSGNGTGSPAPWGAPVETAGDLPVVASLGAGDFDGDGTDDLGASVSQTLGSLVGSVQTFISTTDGLVVNPDPSGAVFSPSTVEPGSPGPFGYGELVADDFNRDGNDDIAFLLTAANSANPYHAGIRLSDGEGAFADAPGSPFPFNWNSSFWALATGDFEGNAAPDLMGGSAYGGGAAPVLLNAPDLITDPDSISFGDHKVGDSSGDRSMDLINQGGPDLTITDIRLDGPDPDQFTLSAETEDCVAALPPAGSCEIAVSFDPTSAGVKTGAILVDYAESETPFQIGIYGKGVVPDASVDPTEIDFGRIRINQTDTDTVTVTSSGDAILEIGQLAVTGDDAARFARSDDNCSNTELEPTETCTVNVTASPTAIGELDATLEIPNDGGDDEVPLTAEGVDPGISVAPATYDFGDAEVDGVGQGRQFTVTSSGTTPLNVTGISVSGLNPGDFDTGGTGCIGSPIPVGQTCTFTGIFSPDSGPVDVRSASFVVSSDASEATVPVTGTATYGDTVITPDPVAFGDVKVGQSATETITLSAEGTASIYIDDIFMSGGNPELYEVTEDGCSGQQTPAGSSCDLEVTFTPDSTGDKSAFLFIDTYSQLQSPELTGTGVDPAGTLTPAAHDFGSVTIGETGPAKAFSVASTGETPLTVTSASVTGPDAGSFRLANAAACNGSRSPGTACDLSVSFAPEFGSATGRSAALRVATSAGTFTSSLNGTAVAAPVPPVDPQLGIKLSGAKKVKRGKKLVITATLTNRGGGAITGIVIGTVVSAKLAKKPRKIKISSLAAGKSVKKKIKIPVKKKAKAGKKLKVTVTATAGGKKLASAKRSAKIKK